MDRHAAATLIAVLRRALLAVVILGGTLPAAAQVTLTQGTNFTVDVARDGRLAMDLMGRIWTLPAKGGNASPLDAGGQPARRPRWAPDASALVYQLRSEGQGRLWLYRFDERTATNISDGQYFDQHPDWHPDGQRIVYSSDRRDTGFDLWELDLETGLTWRISDLAGDETEPAWSADGFDLAYIHYRAGRWSLMMRRHGQPDRVLETSTTRLAAPSWRPDGSLITFIREGPDGLSIDMVILSDPLLIRPLVTGEDFFVGPVAWRDRQNLLYTANGAIRTRAFNSWTSRNVPLRATIQQAGPARSAAPPQRRLPAVEEPGGKLVVRAARLFDGVTSGYRHDLDIVIEGGRIAAVEARHDHDDAIIVDLGAVTVLPGFIDSLAALPADARDALGPALLTLGVTTVVSASDDKEDIARLDGLWAGKAVPGPRVLGGDWRPDLELLASLVPGADTQSVSPAGIRYENGRVAAGGPAGMHLSGLADARTAGLVELLQSRQARLLSRYPMALRRFVEKPRLAEQSPRLVAGSEPNGLPPGIGLHAEFLALAEAGLDAENVLRSAGVNAASALGLDLRIGRIAPGAAADLVVVDGDPLRDVAALRNVVGVVRNGRFYSAIGLIERVEAAPAVE